MTCLQPHLHNAVGKPRAFTVSYVPATNSKARKMLSRTFALITLLSSKLSLFVSCTGSGSCLGAQNVLGPPDFSRIEQASQLKMSIVPFKHQAIIPSYKFNCCGAITEWSISIAISGNDTMDVLSLQVWRPSPAVNFTGCYSLVGNNNFTSVALDSPLTVVNPLPHQRIQFQPGDVLGFYIENTQAGFESGGVMMLSDLSERGDRGYETEEVWYATDLVYSNVNCLAAVGKGKLLDSFTNVAPIISVSYTTTDLCTNSASSVTWTATLDKQSTPIGTPTPTQTAIRLSKSNKPHTTLTLNIVGSRDFILIVSISAAVFVTIVFLTLGVVVLVCVKAKRLRDSKEDRKEEMVGSGASVRALLDLPRTHPIESST